MSKHLAPMKPVGLAVVRSYTYTVPLGNSLTLVFVRRLCNLRGYHAYRFTGWRG